MKIGFIPGMISENPIGKSYTRLAADQIMNFQTSNFRHNYNGKEK